MATAAFPRARRSLLAKVASALAARKRGRARPGAPGRLAALAALARQHVVTVAALASVDTGAFHGGLVAGWVVTGVSLLVADFAVRG